MWFTASLRLCKAGVHGGKDGLAGHGGTGDGVHTGGGAGLCQLGSQRLGSFAAQLTDDGPQVLIVHSHGSEAYTPDRYNQYEESDSYRTEDLNYNVVLSERGISVLHDRTLHDVPDYNDAYPHSLASVEDYMEKYPSLVFVLDVHRDAVSDADGNQYKLVSAEEPHAAQMSFIMGNAYDGWQENLKLAIAIQQNLSADYPTLMRPITMLNYRYNQFVSPGAMLLEVGAAGNSLDEALYNDRRSWFAFCPVWFVPFSRHSLSPASSLSASARHSRRRSRSFRYARCPFSVNR